MADTVLPSRPHHVMSQASLYNFGGDDDEDLDDAAGLGTGFVAADWMTSGIANGEVAISDIVEPLRQTDKANDSHGHDTPMETAPIDDEATQAQSDNQDQPRPLSPANSVSDDTEFDDEEEEADVGAQMPYDLRESARQKAAPAAWIDKDDSGNYDPEEERKRTTVRKRSANGLRVSSTRTPAERARRVYKSLETGRANGAQHIFPVNTATKLTGENSAKATDLLADIDDHWPGESYNYLDEDYLVDQDITGKRLDGLSNEARDRALQPGFDNNGDYIPYADPLGIEDTLLRHPAARGCVPCRRGGWPCSLLSNHSSWPCEACAVDGEDCRLITPPVRKASCESCNSLKIKCSFRDNEVQTTKCDHCIAITADCVAGPAPGYEPVSAQWEEHDLPRHKRSFVACTSCREQKLRCSLKKTDRPPCTACGDHTPCIFEPVYQARSKGKSKNKAKAKKQNVVVDVEMVELPSDNDSEVFEILDPRPLAPSAQNTTASASMAPSMNRLLNPEAPCFNRSIDRTLPILSIHTALCHPITFCCEISQIQFSDPFRDCSFCREPAFAVYGHYEFAHVKVQESHKGLCYEEKSKHGHYARNKPPTRVCTQHSMERYRIAGCKHETIEAFDEQRQSAIRKAFMAPAADVPLEWMCSLCPSPMTCRCTVHHSDDSFGLPNDSYGCGLQLCSYCYDNLTTKFGGRFDNLVEDMVTDDSRYELGKRADIELLAGNGLLVRNVYTHLAKASAV